MGIPYPLKIWKLGQAVAKNTKESHPFSYCKPPQFLMRFKNMLPVLMHGKRITFGDKVSSKGKNRTRRAFYPNVFYRPLYSRALDMTIWSCISSTALRKMDTLGGFDEYLLKVDPKLLDKNGQMYQTKVVAEYQDANSRVNKEKAKFEEIIEQRYGSK